MSLQKKELLTHLIVTVILGILLGVLLLVLDPNLLTTIFFVTVGILLMVDGVISLIANRNNTSFLVLNILSIVFGFLLIFNFNQVVDIIVAIWFIALPLVFVLLNKDYWKDELKKQLPRLVIGAIVLIFGLGNTVGVILTILGWTSIVLAILYLILGLISLSKH